MACSDVPSADIMVILLLIPKRVRSSAPQNVCIFLEKKQAEVMNNMMRSRHVFSKNIAKYTGTVFAAYLFIIIRFDG